MPAQSPSCARGWRDWHLLTGVANIVVNARLARAGLKTPEALRLAGAHERVQMIVSAPEQPTDPALPVECFNVAALDGARRMALPAYIAVWGLRLEGVVPDMEAVERLLEARYRYWSDDVEHDDPFPWVHT